MKSLIFSWTILLFFLVQCKKEFKCNLEHVSVIYDKKTNFRIVPLKSNDLVRWSNDIDKHLLGRKELCDESLSIFKLLRESIVPDSSKYIPTILNQTILNVNDGENEFELAFYDDKKDVPADAMIIYKYSNKCCANDTLFLNYSSGKFFRLNSFIARGDTMLWRKAVAAINSF